ncbi:unnamed protein product [Gordionus sp. m RMFG-2023]
MIHLWPFVLHDLKCLGAKTFFAQFCAGSIDNISIRKMQCILLKVALLLGVNIHEGVEFLDTVEPTNQSGGWKGRFEPADHTINQYEFDVLVGADGKKNTLQGFNRKEFRGKLAIAITANLVNHKTDLENRLEEISGTSCIFNPSFFAKLKNFTDNGETDGGNGGQIDLENLVYYKDDTHYFVMTAKKHSLLSTRVLKQDYSEPSRLLSPSNIDRSALLSYALRVAHFCTDGVLPIDSREGSRKDTYNWKEEVKNETRKNKERKVWAVNHKGQADVNVFDFTSMFQAESSLRIIERMDKLLLIGLVGDALLEPFWPLGTGCPRGFLSSMDMAWTVKQFASNKYTPLQLLAERESVYKLLSQTSPENTCKNLALYSIHPKTRYTNLDLNLVKPFQVRHLYDTESQNGNAEDKIIQIIPKKFRKSDGKMNDLYASNDHYDIDKENNPPIYEEDDYSGCTLRRTHLRDLSPFTNKVVRPISLNILPSTNFGSIETNCGVIDDLKKKKGKDDNWKGKKRNEDSSVKPLFYSPQHATLSLVERLNKLRQSSTPNSVTSSKNSQCHFCSQTIYMLDIYRLEGISLHKDCMKCQLCQKALNLRNYKTSIDSNAKVIFACRDKCRKLSRKISSNENIFVGDICRDYFSRNEDLSSDVFSSGVCKNLKERIYNTQGLVNETKDKWEHLLSSPNAFVDAKKAQEKIKGPYNDIFDDDLYQNDTKFQHYSLYNDLGNDQNISSKTIENNAKYATICENNKNYDKIYQDITFKNEEAGREISDLAQILSLSYQINNENPENSSSEIVNKRYSMRRSLLKKRALLCLNRKFSSYNHIRPHTNVYSCNVNINKCKDKILIDKTIYEKTENESAGYCKGKKVKFCNEVINDTNSYESSESLSDHHFKCKKTYRHDIRSKKQKLRKTKSKSPLKQTFGCSKSYCPDTYSNDNCIPVFGTQNEPHTLPTLLKDSKLHARTPTQDVPSTIFTNFNYEPHSNISDLHVDDDLVTEILNSNSAYKYSPREDGTCKYKSTRAKMLQPNNIMLNTLPLATLANTDSTIPVHKSDGNHFFTTLSTGEISEIKVECSTSLVKSLKSTHDVTISKSGPNNMNANHSNGHFITSPIKVLNTKLWLPSDHYLPPESFISLSVHENNFQECERDLIEVRTVFNEFLDKIQCFSKIENENQLTIPFIDDVIPDGITKDSNHNHAIQTPSLESDATKVLIEVLEYVWRNNMDSFIDLSKSASPFNLPLIPYEISINPLCQSLTLKVQKRAIELECLNRHKLKMAANLARDNNDTLHEYGGIILECCKGFVKREIRILLASVEDDKKSLKQVIELKLLTNILLEINEQTENVKKSIQNETPKIQ